MTITVTEFGPNSSALAYSAGTTDVELAMAIRDWTIQHGWTLHDQVSTSVFVLKAPNIDGESYKYVHINVATNVYILTYESWNATTHVGTNGVIPAGISITNTLLYQATSHLTLNGTLYLFASARYFMARGITSTGTGGSSGFSDPLSSLGVFEITRDNEEDTAAAGYPCHGLIDLAALCGYVVMYDAATYGGNNNGLTTLNTAMLPRTRMGNTGKAASCFTRVSTPIANWGFDYISAFNGYTPTQGAARLINGGSILTSHFPSYENSWSGKNKAYNITVIEDCYHNGGYSKMSVKGRICGLKLLHKSIGSNMDISALKVDSTSLLADKNGDIVDHFILTCSSNLSDVRFAIPV